MFGPVFCREAIVAPQRPQHFFSRSTYLLVLFIIFCTSYMVVSGLRPIHAASDMARFSGWMFLLLSFLQLVILSFCAAVGAAVSIAQEKDRRTLTLLLLTRLSGWEIVAGKLAASLINVLAMMATALPLFLAFPLFGGVSPDQIGIIYGLTFTTVVLSAVLGTVIGLWRESSFQAIAITVLALVIWSTGWELIATGWLPGIPQEYTYLASPLRAIFALSSPVRIPSTGFSDLALGCPLAMLAVACVILSIGVAKIRVWNPSREVRSRRSDSTIHNPSGERDGENANDSKRRPSRTVWENPVLWREIRTWAYGRKILIIRIAYFILCVLIGFAIFQSVQDRDAFPQVGSRGGGLPTATVPIALLSVISMLIVNALAVNSITTERDGMFLDLLLVTDLRPVEFVMGKIWGVLYVTKEMCFIPLAIIVAMGMTNAMTIENMIYAILGLVVLFFFVITLGVHCGLNYSAGRTATLVSLGTVFFLCVGVSICMLIMVSFQGAFQLQLAPFLVMILGGGSALYASLGARNPSSAIFIASFSLPLVTFYSITQFLLQRDQLNVVAVIATGYGFSIAAMLVPALSEFGLSPERKQGEDKIE